MRLQPGTRDWWQIPVVDLPQAEALETVIRTSVMPHFSCLCILIVILYTCEVHHSNFAPGAGHSMITAYSSRFSVLGWRSTAVLANSWVQTRVMLADQSAGVACQGSMAGLDGISSVRPP